MTYMMSDIHGNLPAYRSIMKQLNLKEWDQLFVLGDAIDRHPNGIGILLELMAMPNVRILLGNHEYMMLDALGCPYDGIMTNRSTEEKLDLWFLNGGKETYRAFSKLSNHTRQELIDFLLALPLNLDINVGKANYKLVHGSPVEAYTDGGPYRSQAYCAVWRRVKRWDAPKDDGTLIFGHTATKAFQYCDPMRIWHGPNMLGIDCGAGYDPKHVPKGRLACLRLDDMKEFYG